VVKLTLTFLAVLLAFLYPHYRGETMAACVVAVYWIWFCTGGRS